MDISALNVGPVRPSQILLQYLCALDLLDDHGADALETARDAGLAHDRE